MYKSIVKLSLSLLVLTSGSTLLYSCKDKKAPETTEPAPAPTEPASVTPTQPVTISADDTLRQKLVDATKDFPKVTATAEDGVITLKGEIDRPRLAMLMQSLQTLRPKKINNELVIK